MATVLNIIFCHNSAVDNPISVVFCMGKQNRMAIEVTWRKLQISKIQDDRQLPSLISVNRHILMENYLILTKFLTKQQIWNSVRARWWWWWCLCMCCCRSEAVDCYWSSAVNHGRHCHPLHCHMNRGVTSYDTDVGSHNISLGLSVGHCCVVLPTCLAAVLVTLSYNYADAVIQLWCRHCHTAAVLTVALDCTVSCLLTICDNDNEVLFNNNNNNNLIYKCLRPWLQRQVSRGCNSKALQKKYVASVITSDVNRITDKQGQMSWNCHSASATAHTSCLMAHRSRQLIWGQICQKSIRFNNLLLSSDTWWIQVWYMLCLQTQRVVYDSSMMTMMMMIIIVIIIITSANKAEGVIVLLLSCHLRQQERLSASVLSIYSSVCLSVY